MTEIEYVQDVEIVDDSKPSWESLISEFIEGRRYELHGQLRQARAAANVITYYGQDSMKAFSGEVGKSKSWCYALARVWTIYGHIFESDSELSNRLETLSISHLVKAVYAPDPVALAEKAHDEEMTTRQVEDEASLARNGHEAGNVETIEKMACPHCGEVFAMRDAKQWTEQA